MERSPYSRGRLAALVLGCVVGVGCGSSGPSSPSGGGSQGFSIASGVTTLSLAPRESKSTFVKATRTGGFTGSITFAVSGVPSLLVATVTVTPVADSARIDITAAAAASGSYTIQVTASAPGASPKSLTMTVNVTPAPAVVFQSIYVGDHHACALTAAGVAYCWGKNDALQNGTGNTGSGGQDLVPKPVIGGLTFASLTLPVFGSRACGLTSTGASYCWGDNFNGEMGDGTMAIRGTPTRPSGTLTFQALASGNHHTCALTAGGSAYCWGLNQYGGLGDNTTTTRLTPVAVSTASGKTWSTIVAGLEHTCALTTTGGEVWCWGYGLSGEVGNGTTATSVLVPVKVTGSQTYRAVVAGWEHNCALTTTNQAYCWGYNATGQLGDGSVTNRSAPVAVSGGLTFQSISAGAFHTCGLTAAGAAYCWGTNQSGALGDGTFTDHRTPNPISGGLTFKAIAAGNYSTCGLTTANVAYCWGSNTAGELGDGTLTFKLLPTAVSMPQP